MLATIVMAQSVTPEQAIAQIGAPALVIGLLILVTVLADMLRRRGRG